MKKENFDIKSVPGHGYLVFPLSMSRLSNALAPKPLYEFLEFFESKLSHRSIDVILLYTNDLYLNSDERALDLRKRTLNQMLQHRTNFESLVLKGKRFLPGAFHYLPWDYALLNIANFHEMRSHLISQKNTQKGFESALLKDLSIAGREVTEANLNFLVEELVVSHGLSEHEISLPHTLSNPDGWRLLCYPGNPPESMVYIWRNNLLGNRNDLPKHHELFARSFYNMEQRRLIDFSVTTAEAGYESAPELKSAQQQTVAGSLENH